MEPARRQQLRCSSLGRKQAFKEQVLITTSSTTMMVEHGCVYPRNIALHTGVNDKQAAFT